MSDGTIEFSGIDLDVAAKYKYILVVPQPEGTDPFTKMEYIIDCQVARYRFTLLVMNEMGLKATEIFGHDDRTFQKIDKVCEKFRRQLERAYQIDKYRLGVDNTLEDSANSMKEML